MVVDPRLDSVWIFKAASDSHGSQDSLKQYLASELQIGDRGKEGGKNMLGGGRGFQLKT